MKSQKNGHLYELDGDRKGPVDKGLLAPDEDLLSASAVKIVKDFMQREHEGNSNFGLMALVEN